jgi:hypothetical protein
MGQIPSRKASSRLLDQQIPFLIQTPRVRSLVCKNVPGLRPCSVLPDLLVLLSAGISPSPRSQGDTSQIVFFSKLPNSKCLQTSLRFSYFRCLRLSQQDDCLLTVTSQGTRVLSSVCYLTVAFKLKQEVFKTAPAHIHVSKFSKYCSYCSVYIPNTACSYTTALHKHKLLSKALQARKLFPT